MPLMVTSYLKVDWLSKVSYDQKDPRRQPLVACSVIQVMQVIQVIQVYSGLFPQDMINDIYTYILH